MTDPPNKLCVLTEPYLNNTQISALENAVNKSKIDIPLVIVNRSQDSDYDPESEAKAVNEGLSLNTARLFAKVLSREKAWAFVIAERKIAELLGSDAASSSRIYVEDVPCLSDSEFHHVTPTKDGEWSELSPDTVDLVREHCDVVVRFGFGLIKGEILTATDFGVLSFHLADIRQYRGLGPPQAFIDGRETMGVTLQRINEEIDGGEIVAYDEADVDDCATLWEVYDKLNGIQTELLAEGISNLRDSSPETMEPESLGAYYSTKSRRSPQFASQIILKNMYGRIERKLR